MTNNDEKLTKVVINWFPGHMVKAKKEIKDNLKLVDTVIEIIDARIPKSSRNPDFDELVANKPRIIALNKFDLADEAVNREWISFFKKNGQAAVLINSITGAGIKELLACAYRSVSEKMERNAERGRVGRSVRAAVIGIPNAGKSSFINKVAKRTVANVGNKPGVTRTKQWIRTDAGVELMDTPGILWPKFEKEEIGLHLAFTGAIRSEILDNAEIALKLIGDLRKYYAQELFGRYKIETAESDTDLEIMEKIGKRRGCIVSGGEVDYEKTANIILDEFRKGTIGRISLERP
ncbi:MAG: ribosome biogenesis GTPase YlqF [Clostridia bacterium]|nr:ribosome biogenesis GTPase YlqF [Clostridia bacterium]